jgi:hypothetical protein
MLSIFTKPILRPTLLTAIYVGLFALYVYVPSLVQARSIISAAMLTLLALITISVIARFFEK